MTAIPRGDGPPAYTTPDTERWVPEDSKREGRTQFQRDRARVLHSAALRRLAAKTQVVRAGSGDFPRTRLTHSLECSQIGRELGAALGCDPDLVDAACLAHDLGHPPFGHNGETALAALAADGDPLAADGGALAGGRPVASGGRPVADGGAVACGGPLACGGFEGNAQSLRLLTRLEPKVPGAGLNLTRATLDAAVKYPMVGSGPGKYNAYEADAPAFEWIRLGAPDGRRCLEAQVMDWADDVAYSVHDLEDGLHAGQVTLKNLKDYSEQTILSRVALGYCPDEWNVTAAELEAVFAEFTELPFWDFSFDGGPVSLAAAKNLTSELVGRFCLAAERATLERSAHRPRARSGRARPVLGRPAPIRSGLARPVLTRYGADLVVPRRQLLECALLKAVSAHYVIFAEATAAPKARERELIAELALAVWQGAPQTLDPVFIPSWHAALSDADRGRVVIDQVASLTDTSAIAWHSRLC
ncbi:MAG: deoxyguanosinetriphosphate triphosphohydrolase family protein [Nocardiopsaceae bacterium]|nr:deoxyguanosinetriphosphate triphosphohydrolase family protein [Nocardiopsaceae bacterium]